VIGGPFFEAHQTPQGWGISVIESGEKFVIVTKRECGCCCRAADGAPVGFPGPIGIAGYRMPCAAHLSSVIDLPPRVVPAQPWDEALTMYLLPHK